MPGESNLFGQEPWELRGAGEDRLRALERGATPVGGLIAFYGTVAPTNWLIADGSSFSAATYPALASVLGGTTLPNLKGKVIVGVDAAQVEFDSLGETGGVKTLTSTQMPSHFHPVSILSDVEAGTHVHDAINTFGTSDAAHVHYIGGALGEGSTAPQNVGIGTGRAASSWTPATTSETGTHKHTVAGDTDPRGSGAAGGNLAPYMALNWIIRAA